MDRPVYQIIDGNKHYKIYADKPIEVYVDGKLAGEENPVVIVNSLYLLKQATATSETPEAQLQSTS